MRAWAPGGVDSALAIQPGTPASSRAVVRDGGHLVSVSGDPCPSERGIFVEQFAHRPDVGADMAELVEAIAHGRINLEIERVYAFDEALAALEKTETRHARGKVVVEVRRAGTSATKGTRRRRRGPSVAEPVRLEVWSDISCPWCYIAKRLLDQALVYAAVGTDLTVTYRSFQVSPDAPQDFEGSAFDFLVHHKGIPAAQVRQGMTQVARIAASVGLVYDVERLSPTNTGKAHQVLHLARPAAPNWQWSTGYFRFLRFLRGGTSDQPRRCAR